MEKSDLDEMVVQTLMEDPEISKEQSFGRTETMEARKEEQNSATPLQETKIDSLRKSRSRKKVIMKETVLYKGPNVRALFPVMEAVLDLGELVDRASNKNFARRITDVLPGLKEHKCSKGSSGGFIERLEEGTYPAHIIEHAALAIQEFLGFEAKYGKSHRIEGTLYRVITDCQDEQAAVDAVSLSVEIVNKLLTQPNTDPSTFSTRLLELQRIHSQRKTGPSTRAILEAARKRHIPLRRMDEEYNLFSLGWGSKQRRIWASVTSETSMTACDIAQDKALTKRILQDANIPVPRGEVVQTIEETLEAAHRIGWPVLMKPVDGHHGRGVMGNLCSDEEVKKGYEVARTHGSRLLVEEFLTGDDYRFLVVGYTVAAVSKRIPAHVQGDGFSTIRALVDRINLDPNRGTGHESFLTRLKIDEEELQFLKSQGISPDYVPGDGKLIFLRAGANLSTGGTANDVINIVHPSIIASMERAARIIGLDIAGIDVMAEDITRPLQETGGAVVEVNAGPGLRMHIKPSEGHTSPVADIIIDHLFPQGDGRIPLVAITGTNGKTTTSRMVEHMARTAGHRTGMAVTGGVYIDGHMVAEGDTTGPWSARLVLDDPAVNFAVLETARGGIRRRGLGFDRCMVGAVLNIREDHFGVDGVEDLEDLFWIKSLVMEATDEEGYCVINAMDAFAKRLMEKARGKVVLFSGDKCPLAVEHAASGGRVFTVEDKKIVYYEKEIRHILSGVEEVPCLIGGVRSMTENLLAAAASAYCAGIGIEDIIAGFKTFQCTAEANPGRFNVYNIMGKTVLIDYAHNPDSIRALGEYARALGGKTRIAFTAPGDRRDELIEACGHALAECFDDIYLTENPQIVRGRRSGEIISLLYKGVEASGKTSSIHPCHNAAAIHLLETGEPGEVIVLADLDFTPGELENMFNTCSMYDQSS